MMNIGLPGRCQRYMQIVRHEHSKNAHITWSCNLNDIRAEIPDHLQNPLVMPQEQKIEFVVAVEREFHPAAGQLHSGKSSICYHFATRAGVNHEEIESVFLCECGKLPAGIRDAVNFAVGARKQRNPDMGGRHAMTSCGTSEPWCKSDDPLNVKFRACLTEAFSTMRKMEKMCPRKGGGAFQRADKGR